MALFSFTNNRTQNFKFGERIMKRQVDFKGGLDTLHSPFASPENTLVDLQNFELDLVGGLRKRKGSRKRYASPFASGGVLGLTNYIKSSDKSSRVVAAADGKLFYDFPQVIKRWDSQTEWDQGSKTGVDTATEPGKLLLTSIAAPTFARNDPTTQQTIEQSTYQAWYLVYGNNQVGQSIKIPDCVLVSVDLRLGTFGSPPGALTVEVRSGSWTGIVVASASHSGISSTNYYTFTFQTPPTLSNGVYYIIVKTVGGDPNNYYGVYGATSNVYADGTFASSSDGGTTWTEGSATDLTFKVTYKVGGAYKSDGKFVAPNTPRYEPGQFGQAIMIEEGTTNLLTANQSSVETDLTGFAASGATLTRDTTTAWHGSASLKVATPGSVVDEGFFVEISAAGGATYTASVYLKGFGNVEVVMADMPGLRYVAGATVTLNANWQRVNVTGVLPAGATGIRLFVRTVGAAQVVTFWADGLQIEQKPYPTSWTLGGTTRAAETLTIPTAGVLNPQEGTIEFWLHLNDLHDWNDILGGSEGFPGGGRWLFFADANGLCAWSWSPGPEIASVSGVLTAGAWHYVALRWGQGTKSIWINGVKRAEGSHDGSYGFPNPWGFGIYNGDPNCLIDDLRISSRARTDQEIAAAYQSGQPLPADEWTTYKLNFNGNLNPGRGGVWVSPAIDLTSLTNKSGRVDSLVSAPSGSTVKVQTATSADNVTYSAWQDLNPDGTIASPSNNYCKIRIVIDSTEISTIKPFIDWVQATFQSNSSMTQFASGLAAVPYEFATYADTLWIVNGINTMKKWDGTTFADAGGNPPQSNKVIAHKNRLFLAYGTRLYFSDLGNPESWPALNFIEVGRGDGDTIQALAVLNDNLYIFKDASIWVLQGSGPDDFVLRSINRKIGTVAPRSVVSIDNATLGFWGTDGFYVFDGVEAVLVSKQIQNTVRNINLANAGKIAAFTHDRKVYISFPESGPEPNAMLVYFLDLNAWSLYRGVAATVFTRVRVQDEYRLVWGAVNEGQLYEWSDDYYDAGTPVVAYLETPHYSFGVPERLKRYRSVFVMADAAGATTTAKLYLRADQAPPSGPLTLNVSDSGKLNVIRALPSALGVSVSRTLAVRLVHDTPEGLAVHGVMVEYVPKGVR